MFRGRRQRQPGMGILLLAMQVMRHGVNNIPPVTLIFLALNTLVYLQLIDSVYFVQPLQNVCISAIQVWFAADYKRLILSAFYHADDFHLYYNMASFLSKGKMLENRLGSIRFLLMLAVFTVLTNCVYVGLAMTAEQLMHDSSYITQCAVGFSGVIFALKVVTSNLTPHGQTSIMGIPVFVPVKYACWVELVIIHLLIPNASFLGHLAGILVGTLYVYGPLKSIMDMPWNIGLVGGGRANTYQYRAEPSGYRAGTARRVQDQGDHSGWDNDDTQEVMRRSREEYFQQHDYYNTQQQPTPSAPPEPQPQQQPNAEDLRQRRLHRFS